MKPSKVRVRLETALAVFAGGLGLLTLFWPAWIEGITGWDPDNHNGTFEWLIVATLLVLSAAMSLLVAVHRRLLVAAAEGGSDG